MDYFPRTANHFVGDGTDYAVKHEKHSREKHILGETCIYQYEVID